MFTKHFHILCAILFQFVLLYSSQQFKKDKFGFTIINGTDINEFIDRYSIVISLFYISNEPTVDEIIDAVNNASALLDTLPDNAILIKASIGFGDDLIDKYGFETPIGIIAILDHGERNVEFTGKFKQDEILHFMKQKLLPPITMLNSYQQFKQTVENVSCVSLGLFEKTHTNELEAYKIAADWFYECLHFYTTDPDLQTIFHPSKSLPTILFYKGCIHDVRLYPSQLPLSDHMNMLKFMVVANQPDVGKFGMEWLMKRHLRQPRFTLMLFVKKGDPRLAEFKLILDKYARRYRDEINMAYIEISKSELEAISLMRSQDIFDEEKELPALRAIEQSYQYANNTRKYRPRLIRPVSDSVLNQFIGDVYYRQLSPFLLSERTPSFTDKDSNCSRRIITVTGDNFRNVTSDPNVAVLIVFHSGEYRYQDLLSGPLSRLADEYADRGDILIGRANVSANEYYGWHPERFPTVILFPRGQSDVWGVVCKTNFTYKDMRSFIESNGRVNEEAKEKTDTESNKGEKVKEQKESDADDEDEVAQVKTEL